MEKRNGILLFIGAGLEAIGWGAGMIEPIPPQIGYAVVGLGLLIVVYAGIRYIRYEPIYPTWQELQARGEAKRWYLDPLNNSIEQIINAYSPLAHKAVIFPLEKYNDKYFRVKTRNNKDILARMTTGKFWLNNRYYGELKNSNEMDSIKLEYQKWYSNIIDKKLKQELNKLWKCEHEAKSNEIFYEIERINFKETLSKAKIQSWQKGNAKREYEKQLSKVSTRIEELLGGVPDEQ